MNSKKITYCRGCGQPIIFVKTYMGKSMPCNPKARPFWRRPGAAGKVVSLSGEVISCDFDGPPSTVSGTGYESHFSTCPKANTFRKKK